MNALAVPGFPAYRPKLDIRREFLARHAADLPARARDASEYFRDRLDTEFLLPALASSTSADGFIRFFTARWEALSDLLAGFRAAVAAALPEETVVGATALAEEADAQLTAAIAVFSDEARRETADFALFTARGADATVLRFVKKDAEPSNAQHDRELARAFASATTWQLVARSALQLVLEGRAAPSPELFDGLLDILRTAALDAYTAAREAEHLREAPLERESLEPGLVDSGLAEALADEDFAETEHLLDQEGPSR